MKKMFLFVFIVLFSLSLNSETFAQEETKKEKQEVKNVSNKPFNTVCPVSTEPIENSKFTYEYKGKTYAVCCNSCLKKIKKDPEKYISRLSEDGKSIKKK